MVKVILASASPRRRELLTSLGVEFDCLPADIDETPGMGEVPEAYVARMAREKARAVALRSVATAWVLGSDTTVVLAGKILGKPHSESDAVSMLAQLSGQTHSVYTAVALVDAGSDALLERTVKTQVTFAALDEAACRAYVASGEPMDKAGAYGIQGLGGALVTRIEGSYSNVVGLPLYETWQLLQRIGIASALQH